MYNHLTKFSGKFYLKNEKISKQGYQLSPLLFNTVLEVPFISYRLLQTETAHCKRMKLDPYFTPHTKQIQDRPTT